MGMQIESITLWCEDCGHRVSMRKDQPPIVKCPKCCGVTKMTFGKYGPSKTHPQGMDIAFINSSYLRWALEQDWFWRIRSSAELEKAIERELEVRDRSDGHFYEDKVKV